jgi:general secretion pathway protein M
MSNPASKSGSNEMPKLDREQVFSVAALALLLLLCVSVVGLLLQARADAVRQASERHEILARLEARLRTVSSRPTAAAPPSAFLDASTQGLASAQLQSYLAQLADDQRASLVSSGGEAGKRDDAPDTIRLQATLDMNLKALRAFLYQLESGTPYVFVDTLTVQPAGAMAGRAVEDPLLRTTLSLRAFWRRGTP